MNERAETIEYARPATEQPVRASRARRLWDWCVGLFMIAAGSIVLLFVAGLIAMGIGVALPETLARTPGFGVVLIACVALIVLLAAFYDFHRRRTINTAYSESGIIHLVPRGVSRIRHGHEDR